VFQFRLLSILLVICLSGCARQVYRSEAMPSSVTVAHKHIIAADKSSSIRFELKLPYEKLTFRRYEEGYRATVRYTCRAEHREDGRVETLVLNDVVTCEKFSRCHSTEDFIKRSFSLPLGPGEWRVEIDLYPSTGDRFWRKTVLVNLPHPEDGKLYLDGPRWTSTAPASTMDFPILFQSLWNLSEDRTGFVEGLDAEVDLECALICWDDDGGGDGEYLLNLQDRQGNMVWFNRRTVTVMGGRNSHHWTIPVAKLSAGAYLLKVDFISSEGRSHLEGRLDVGLTRAAFSRDWDKTMDMIVPLATADELDDLRRAPEHFRLAQWRLFWERRDPNGAAAGNSFQDEIGQRITAANQLFSSSRSAGYLSDRGQVYLELGSPDRVEAMTDDRSYHSVLTWYYTRLGRIYVFESGYGGDGFTLTRVTG
jgi:GWxTD domain-containing protein